MRQEFVPRALSRSKVWLDSLVDVLPDPVRESLPDDDGFRWRFPEDTREVIVVCKAVRMSSALSAAWKLAKTGFTTESASLLRLVGDFHSEIVFVAESLFQGRETRSQEDFREQFFEPLPRNLEEMLEEEKRHFVSRGEIAKATKKLAERAGEDADKLSDLGFFISFGLNSYVHGAYETAMELYRGPGRGFEIHGVSDRGKQPSIRAVCTKATEALHGLEIAALALGKRSVSSEIAAFLRQADPSLSDARND